MTYVYWTIVLIGMMGGATVEDFPKSQVTSADKCMFAANTLANSYNKLHSDGEQVRGDCRRVRLEEHLLAPGQTRLPLPK